MGSGTTMMLIFKTPKKPVSAFRKLKFKERIARNARKYKEKVEQKLIPDKNLTIIEEVDENLTFKSLLETPNPQLLEEAKVSTSHES